MLHVEDLILPLNDFVLEAAQPHRNALQVVMQRWGEDTDWNVRFLSSLVATTGMGKPISTAQATVLLKLISTHRTELSVRFGSEAVERLIKQPVYRIEPYQTRQFPREVRHVGGNLLALRFKLDPRIVDFLRTRMTNAMGVSATRPRFDPDSRLWIVPVTRGNLSLVMSMIAEFDFAYDEATLEWLTLAHNAEGASSHFFSAPELPDQIVANVCDNEYVSFFVTEIMRGEPA